MSTATCQWANGNLPILAMIKILVDKNFDAFLSVIYLPFYDEIYTAIKNEGAFLNGKRIIHEIPKLDIVSYGLPGDASARIKQITKAITKLVPTKCKVLHIKFWCSVK